MQYDAGSVGGNKNLQLLSEERRRVEVTPNCKLGDNKGKTTVGGKEATESMFLW